MHDLISANKAKLTYPDTHLIIYFISLGTHINHITCKIRLKILFVIYVHAFNWTKINKKFTIHFALFK